MAVESQNEANIDVSDFIESEFCQITADGGSVQANRIKTESMIVSTQSGDVICTGHIQGTVNISSNSGNVVSEQRFIGPSLDISTDTGDIRVASSYADQSKFVTNKGRIHLRNIHNESYIASYESGDVKVKGIDGSTNIFVKTQSGKVLSNIYMMAWQKGLKTTYYLRSLGATQVNKASTKETTGASTPQPEQQTIQADAVACSILDPSCEACQ